MNDNYTWKENQNGSVTITGYTGNDGDIIIPSEIDRKSVTSIGDWAFYKCIGLTNVTIPESITSIGKGAFADCTGLIVINVDKNSESYTSEDGVLFDKNKTTLIAYPGGEKGAYTIPNGVTKISDKAFAGCIGLTNVTIPESVTSIGGWAFYKCIGLTNVTIPESVTSIGGWAFYKCIGLTNVTIPESVIEMGNNVFCECNNIIIHGYKNSYAETYANENGLTFAEINTDTTNDYEWLEDENGNIAIMEYTGNDGDIIIPSKIDGKFVTSIGRWAFEDCAELISITIPNSVTSIGHWTFENCRKLTAINVDKNNKNYTSEDGVLFDKNKATLITYPKGKRGSYIIPDGVTSIDDCAFSHCKKLTSVTIPDSITSILGWTFYDCTELTDVTIPTSVIEMDNDVFYKCDNVVIHGYKNSYAETYANENGLTFAEINIEPTDYYEWRKNKNGGIEIANYIGNGGNIIIPSEIYGKPVTTIGNSAFYNCKKLISVIIPKSVTLIKDYAFYGCEKLTSIDIPDSITEINDETFAGCKKLTNITIPNSVKTIGDLAFNNCTELTNVTISNNVTSISNSAFFNCTGLTSINVDENNKNYTSEDGVLFNKDKTTLIKCPARKKDSYTIPNGVTTISDYAFSNCTELTNIIIPDSVTEIKNLAFYNCTGLTDITVPDSVIKIGAFIFDECNNLNIHGHKNSCIEVYANRNKIYANKNKIAFVEINTKTVKDYKWQENEDDGVTITNYIGNDSNIIIPSEINNKPVTSISVDAFSFLHCKELTSITIPDSIVSINNPAFINCLKLTSINVDKNNKNYSSKDGILFCKDKSANLTVLMVCPACKKGVYTIPDGVKAINEYAFFYCKELTDIIIPDSVVSIDDLAFNNCVKPPVIHSSKNSYIETYANKNKIPFVVTNTGVIDNYEWIENQDGSLTIEYYVGSNNDIIVPSKINGKPVTAIGDCAFEDCTELTNVIIPDSINDIGEYAFAGCSKLKSITIPDSVSIIEDNSFDKCNNLIIYSCKNSCAEDYANENKIPFVVADIE